ncbi:ParB N-terminal domain-containing protein [Achromobacter xylosoxidans]|uniref:ParB N-terminal domain-containing protein n=1 Tax=Alcaligenes xylosoxydans xylosoxydans TaxID=85698 RepID=UPI00047E07BC|nr:ParB N-terminal domain-containing protein [Achromobacter xylosoxidans]
MKPASKKVDLDQMIASRLSERSPEPAAIESAVTNVITLNVRDDCRLYERNPRTVRNEKFDEIKESIRKRGLDQMIAVTQRPGEKQHIPAKGGNTRLEILQELVAEGEVRFLYMDFVKVPYRSEAALLAAHMVENDQRSGLLFWDAARSTFDLKQEMERERGAAMSLRDFSEHLKTNEGIQASPALLSHYGFTMKHLADLACAANHLSRRDVQDRFIPARSRLASIASKLGAEDALEEAWTLAIGQMRESYLATKSLDFGAFSARLDENFAQRATLTVDELQRAALIVQANSDVDAASLMRDAKQPPSVSGGTSGHSEVVGGGEEGSAQPPTAGAAEKSPSEHRERSEDSFPAQHEKPHAGSASSKAGTLQSTVDDRGAAERELWHALEELAMASRLQGCLQSIDELPLRFMVEIPSDVGGHLGSLQEQALQGGDYAERYYAWWWLVLLSQQNTPAGLLVVPDCEFKRQADSTESWQEACETLLGDPVYADGSYHVVRRMTDASDATGLMYLRVIQAVRQFNQAFPERSTQSFWSSVGVPAELMGGMS